MHTELHKTWVKNIVLTLELNDHANKLFNLIYLGYI